MAHSLQSLMVAATRAVDLDQAGHYPQVRTENRYSSIIFSVSLQPLTIYPFLQALQLYVQSAAAMKSYGLGPTCTNPQQAAQLLGKTDSNHKSAFFFNPSTHAVYAIRRRRATVFYQHPSLAVCIDRASVRFFLPQLVDYLTQLFYSSPRFLSFPPSFQQKHASTSNAPLLSLK